MIRTMFIGLFASLLPMFVFTDPVDLHIIDAMHEKGFYEESTGIIESSLQKTDNRKTKAELLWRYSRMLLVAADEKKENGASKGELLALYEQGTEYAERAIACDPGSYKAYFFKASNIGRWGQTKGIFEALNKTEDMRANLVTSLRINPDFSLSWYVLGMLYEQLPGGIISFGNIPYSVSLGRKAIDVMQEEIRSGRREEVRYDFYTELASHLYKRNWNKSLRARKQKLMLEEYKKKSDVFEKNCYYEGTVELEYISDREEAKKLLDWTINRLKLQSNPSRHERGDLEKACKLRKQLR